MRADRILEMHIAKADAYLSLNESSLTLKGYKVKDNFTWLFGRGRWPNGLVINNQSSYDIILFKSNKMFHSGTVKPDASAVDIAKLAKSQNMLKKAYFAQKPNDFYSVMVVKHNVHPSTLSDLFPDMKNANFSKTQKVGNFDIVYNTEKEAKHLGELFSEACKLLTKHNYDKICYGKVISTPQLRNNDVLANYSVQEDHIRVSSKARKSQEAVKTLVHELGHRLYYKFMNKTQHKKIQEMYEEMMGLKFQVELGDRFLDHKGNEIEIYDTAYSKGRVYYRFERDDGKYRAPADVLSTFKFLGNKDSKASTKDVHPFQVSHYARSKPEEFFAEVFAHAIYHKRDDLLKWVKSI